MLWGDVAGGIVQYIAGVFNGDPDNSAADADINHAKDFAGRLFFRPFRTEGLRDFGNLGVGLAAQTGNRKGRLPTSDGCRPQTGLAPYRTAGQNTFFQYLAPATDTTGALTTFTHERATRLNPQLYYYYGPFGLLAEYVWLRAGGAEGEHHDAAHAAGGARDRQLHHRWHRGLRRRHARARVRSRHGTTWARCSSRSGSGWLGIDDATFPTYANPLASARTAKGLAGGATWVLRRSFRVGLLYEQTWFEGGAGTAATASTPATIANRPTEYLLQGRAQVNF